MNQEEAKAILTRRLGLYRERSFDQLAARVGSCDVELVSGPSGATYHFEFEIVWDGKAGGDVRVIGGIDDGGLRALVPLTDAFIMAPSGDFVDE